MKRTFACIVFLSFILFLITSIGSAQTKDEGMAIFLQAQELQENANSIDQLKVALKKYDEALRVFETIGADYEIGFTLLAMGSVYQSWEDYSNAMKYYEKTLAITRKIGEQAGESAVLNNIGLVYKLTGQYQKSLEYYEKSLVITRKIGNVRAERATFNNLEKVKALIAKNDENFRENISRLPISSSKNNIETQHNQPKGTNDQPENPSNGPLTGNVFLVLLVVIIIVSIKPVVTFFKKKAIQQEQEQQLAKDRKEKMDIETQEANRLEEKSKREFFLRCFLEGPPALEESPIILKKGEEAYYHSTVNVYQEKTVTKTHRVYGGTRIKIGSLPLYFGASTPISTSKEVLSEVGDGELVVTNQRVVIMGSKVNYSIKLSDINDFDISGDDVQIFSEGKYGGRSYLVEDGWKVSAILTALLKSQSLPKLIMASYVNKIDVVERLLKQGTDVDTKQEDGATALMAACDRSEDRLSLVDNKQDLLSLIKLLLKKGADISAANQASITALMIASASGFLDAVKLLVEHGADINAKDKDGRTALMYAESKSQSEVVSFLLGHGALPLTKEEKSTSVIL